MKNVEIKNFELQMHKNVVVAPSHPAYFKHRFVLKINNEKGVAEVKENGYTLNEIAIDEVKTFVLKNLKKLQSLSKKKLHPMEGGSASSISLTNNDIKIEVSGYVEKKTYDKIFSEIENLIDKAVEEGNAFTDKNSPNPIKNAEKWEKEYEERKKLDLEQIKIKLQKGAK